MALRKQPSVSKTFQDAEQGIELISTGLLMLEQASVKELIGSKAVDVCARLNAQYCALEKLITPIKDNIKAEAIRGNNNPDWDLIQYRGESYQANVRRVIRTVLDMTALKEFLGKKIYKYQDRKPQVSVDFSVKE